MESQTIKSARRVLEVLELFCQRRDALTVGQIATGLGYPQSSTSVLMRSLLELGYVDYLPDRRAYCPTLRVSRLAGWCDDPLFDRHRLAGMLDNVRTATGGSAILAVQHQINLNILMTAEGAVLPPSCMQGAKHPLSASALGLVILAAYDQAVVGRMLRRIHASHVDVPAPQATGNIRRARHDGYAISTDGLTPGAAMVAVRLEQPGSERKLAVGVVDHLDSIERGVDQYVWALRQAVAPFLGRGAAAADYRMPRIVA